MSLKNCATLQKQQSNEINQPFSTFALPILKPQKEILSRRTIRNKQPSKLDDFLSGCCTVWDLPSFQYLRDRAKSPVASRRLPRGPPVNYSLTNRLKLQRGCTAQLLDLTTYTALGRRALCLEFVRATSKEIGEASRTRVCTIFSFFSLFGLFHQVVVS